MQPLTCDIHGAKFNPMSVCDESQGNNFKTTIQSLCECSVQYNSAALIAYWHCASGKWAEVLEALRSQCDLKRFNLLSRNLHCSCRASIISTRVVWRAQPHVKGAHKVFLIWDLKFWITPDELLEPFYVFLSFRGKTHPWTLLKILR